MSRVECTPVFVKLCKHKFWHKRNVKRGAIQRGQINGRFGTKKKSKKKAKKKAKQKTGYKQF